MLLLRKILKFANQCINSSPKVREIQKSKFIRFSIILNEKKGRISAILKRYQQLLIRRSKRIKQFQM